MAFGKWFKSQLFDGDIDRTIGEVSGTGRGLVKTLIKVHTIRKKDNPNENYIGIELVAKSFLSYQMMPITLPRSEADTLIQMVKNALE